MIRHYLPCRGCSTYVGARSAAWTFLGSDNPRVPYVIGVAGSVAVGKSTTSRVLQALLAHWPSHPQVDLITTDGFLLPQRVLRERGLEHRKGFPESYDLRRLVQFMAEVKSGSPEVKAPVYSHLSYDIVPEHTGCAATRHRDCGRLNVPDGSGRGGPSMFVSDYFDFSIYVDAQEADVEQWYVERFLTLRETVFKDPSSYFHRYSELTTAQAVETAHGIWQTINRVNLRDNVSPTRSDA
jgi:type I pantothenate kinase